MSLRSCSLVVLSLALSASAAQAVAPFVVGEAPVGHRTPTVPSAAAPSPLVLGSGYHFLYPTSANVQGAYGAYFKTKMTILNVTNQGYDIRAGFSNATGEVSAMLIHIGPGESLTSDNFVWDVFGLTGGGAIDLDSRYDGRTDHYFLTNAVVYVDIGGGGRYYMSIQPADFTGLAIPSRPAILVGVSVNGTTRTNVGCASNSPYAQTISLQAFNPNGSAASGVYSLNLMPWGWGQVGVSGTFNAGTVLMQTSDSNGAACYGTEINNVTNDATFYLGIPY